MYSFVVGNTYTHNSVLPKLEPFVRAASAAIDNNLVLFEFPNVNTTYLVG